MSSMHRKTNLIKPLSISFIGLITAAGMPLSSAHAETAASEASTAETSAQSNMFARQGGSDSVRTAEAVRQWEYLTKTRNLGFSQYAGFITSNPGFPQESLLQTRAENALDDEPIGQQTLIAFFDANPPITNAAKARYALALSNVRRPEAMEIARDAWRGGTMSDPAEAYLLGLYGAQFSAEDHAARMDALLWQRNAEAAVRHIVNIAPAGRDLAMARLALIQGETPSQAGLTVPTGSLNDPGYVYNLARHYRVSRQISRSIDLMASRPEFARPALDPELMVGEMLRTAKAADSSRTVRIASKIDDLFAPGEDISKKSFRLRDDYTSLM